LVRTARAWGRAADVALAAHGLSRATALPLTVLLRLGDGVRQVALADHVGIEGPTLVRALDQLQASDLIERRDDPADRRARTIHLTRAGRQRAEEAEAALAEMRRALLAEIGEAELETALSVLARVARAAREQQG
jgi:MarR family transcriptional regulator for hemolysin